MSDYNQYIAQDAAAMENPFDFAGAADNKSRVGVLIDAISKEATDPTDHRLYLDEMSPACRASLYRVLTDMQTSIENVV